MYIPKHFQVTDRSLMEEYIRNNSFATIISAKTSEPFATHIPVELEINETGEKVLWGHIAKANPQWKTFTDEAKVLVIFLSPVNHYISSSWYNYTDAPTWNYMSVHVTGQIRLMETGKRDESVRRLIRKYEEISNEPIAFDTLPKSVLKQMDGLVAFEIQIEKMEGAFKLSQNRDDENYESIIHHLKATGEVNARLMAEVLEKKRKTKS